MRRSRCRYLARRMSVGFAAETHEAEVCGVLTIEQCVGDVRDLGRNYEVLINV